MNIARMEKFEQIWSARHDLPAESLAQYRFESREGYRLPELAAHYRTHCESLQSAWQPMETCPKHVDVLFFHERNGVIPGRLTDADSFMTDRERDELQASDEERFGIDAFGFGHWGVDRMDGSEAPTHWMPFPSEPSE